MFGSIDILAVVRAGGAGDASQYFRVEIDAASGVVSPGVEGDSYQSSRVNSQQSTVSPQQEEEGGEEVV